MRITACRAITLLGLFLMLATASARAQGYALEQAVMDIPFDFAVGESRLKAGRYVVVVTPTTLRISSKDGRQTVITMPLRTLQPKGIPASPQLVFRRYGDRYFLREAWATAQGLGYELRQSRAEREEAAKNSAAPREVALIPRR